MKSVLFSVLCVITAQGFCSAGDFTLDGAGAGEVAAVKVSLPAAKASAAAPVKESRRTREVRALYRYLITVERWSGSPDTPLPDYILNYNIAHGRYMLEAMYRNAGLGETIKDPRWQKQAKHCLAGEGGGTPTIRCFASW